jgi:hypothetical protein
MLMAKSSAMILSYMENAVKHAMMFVTAKIVQAILILALLMASTEIVPSFEQNLILLRATTVTTRMFLSVAVQPVIKTVTVKMIQTLRLMLF